MGRLYKPFLVVGLGAFALLAGTASAHSADARQFTPQQIEFFESKVRPLLATKCYRCHGDEKQKGGLRVDTRETLLTGGESGSAFAPGRPDESLLIEAINYESLEMPPEGRLKKSEIATLSQWISMGAPWPEDKPIRAAAVEPFEITEEDRNYWAFQPITRPALPKVKQTAWAKGPIDTFVLARLEEKGLSPNPATDKRTLIRRLYLDLTGLPPSPEEVARFVTDDSPAAFEKLVDDLLSRAQYGQRWGRFWLDVVRFAQTNGYERDDEKPHAWRYRDYVIRAFNEDKPYDRFVREQLAGDELEETTHDSIIATGFYRLGVWDDEPDDRLQAEYDEYDEIIRTAGSAFLGLTLGCARCHDHMFDPVSQEDYYQLLAYFRNIELYGKSKSETHLGENRDGIFTPLATAAEVVEWNVKKDRLQQEIIALQQRVEALRAPVRERLFAEQQQQSDDATKAMPLNTKQIDEQLDEAAKAKKKKLDEEIEQHNRALDSPGFPLALSVRESGDANRETRVLTRGKPTSPGEQVEPRLPAIFGGQQPAQTTLPPLAQRGELHKTLADLGVKQTIGLRRVLADWISSPSNPLTSRVLVNRLWQHHFGRGLVASPNNFGRAGLPPTHPQLLDWLAAEFMAGGWKIKRMHKLIVMSNTYRMSSRADNEQAMTVDSGNELLWRQNMRRLDADAIRDSLLTVSGKLNLEMGGRGIFPPLSKAVLATQSQPGKGWGKSDENQQFRRSVYIFVKRTLMVPLLETFDYNNTAESLGRRPVTTVAPQALMLLNSEFLLGQAGFLAERIIAEVGEEADEQIERAFQLALLRAPTTAERQIARNVLENQQNRFSTASDPNADDAKNAKQMSLRSLCLIILNTNEFIYVD